MLKLVDWTSSSKHIYKAPIRSKSSLGAKNTAGVQEYYISPTAQRELHKRSTKGKIFLEFLVLGVSNSILGIWAALENSWETKLAESWSTK